MIETELKFRIPTGGKSKYIKKLVGLGFIISRSVHETTTMYDNEHGILAKDNARLRLRGEFNSKTKNLRAEISYKRPLPAKDGAKREIEHTVHLNGASNMEKILEKLSFSPVSSYEKKRHYLLKNGIQVTVDEYPFDTFIEIEGKSKDIWVLAQKLGFSKNESLVKPCDTLYQEWRKKRGLPFKSHMRFKDYDK